MEDCSYIKAIASLAEFESEVIHSEKPVVVDCHASWCPPCKALGPLIKTWIQAKGGKVKLILVDVDEADEVAAKLGVEAMPTVYGYYKGGEYKKIVGKNDAKIKELIDQLAAKE